jgi:PTH1 family peptidyl-tRNA hydrolase
VNLFNIFKRKQKRRWLITGLGNPGIEYENTRHNAGFLFIDSLSICGFKNKFNSYLAESEFSGAGVIFLKPQTFMNLSGIAVKSVFDYYKIQIGDFILIFDDIYLPLGKIKIKTSGSHGSHNGVKNVIDSIGTNKFKRIKIGVGAKPSGWDLKKWVTSRFSQEENVLLSSSFELALSSLSSLIVDRS